MLPCMVLLSQALEVCDPGGDGRAAVCMVTAQQVVEFVDGGVSGAAKAQQVLREGSKSSAAACPLSLHLRSGDQWQSDRNY